jgi:hypothetical protein
MRRSFLLEFENLWSNYKCWWLGCNSVLWLSFSCSSYIYITILNPLYYFLNIETPIPHILNVNWIITILSTPSTELSLYLMYICTHFPQALSIYILFSRQVTDFRKHVLHRMLLYKFYSGFTENKRSLICKFDLSWRTAYTTCVTSSFCQRVDENCNILGFYTAIGTNFIQTFRHTCQLLLQRPYKVQTPFKIGQRTIEDKTDRLSRNFGMYLPLRAKSTLEVWNNKLSRNVGNVLPLLAR